MIPIDAVLQSADIGIAIGGFYDKLNLITASCIDRADYRQVQGRQGAVGNRQIIAGGTRAVGSQRQRNRIGIACKRHIKCIQGIGIRYKGTAGAAVAPGAAV